MRGLNIAISLNEYCIYYFELFLTVFVSFKMRYFLLKIRNF